MATILSANNSTVKVDGKEIPGLQAIGYTEITPHTSVYNIGNRERVEVVFGAKSVTGRLVIRSNNADLDKLITDTTKTQIIFNLKRQTTIGEEATKTVTFDEVIFEKTEFGLNTNSVAEMTYHFTATRVRLE